MKKIAFYILIAILMSSASSVYAQNSYKEYTLLEPLPCVPTTTNQCTDGQPITKIDLNTYIEYVFKFSIALAVLLAVVMIIFGGFKYMMSAVPYLKIEAKSTITNAIMGLLGALASYLILQTIDPRLVQITTTIEPLNINIDRDVVDFQGKLYSELKKFTVQDREKIAVIDKKIDVMKARIDELERNYYGSDTGVITDAEEKELQKLKLELRALDIEGTKIFVHGIGIAKLNSLNVYIDNPTTDDKLKKLNYAQIEAAKKEFSDPNGTFQKGIEDLRVSGDKDAYENARRLEYFFKDQVEEQEKLADVISSVPGPHFRSKIETIAAKKKLEPYTKPIDESHFVKRYGNNPETLDLYRRLAIARKFQAIDALRKLN
jgi:hypothetical protein